MKRNNQDALESTDFKTRQITELYSEDEQFDPALHSDYTINLDKELHKENREDIISDILKTFPVREKVVMRCRFNIANLKRMNLHEIGAYFMITSECVRQLERRALKRLKARLSKLGISQRKDFSDD